MSSLPRLVGLVVSIPLLLGGSAGPVLAQARGSSASGSDPLTPRVAYGHIRSRQGDGSAEHEWLSVAVLWRGQPGWHESKPTPIAESRIVERRVAAARDSLQDAWGDDWLGPICSADGGHVHCFAYSHEGVVRVLDQRIPAPGRDSLLVVMVDRVDGVGGPPRMVGSLVIAEGVPAAAGRKMWRNGDTTFIVEPRGLREAIPDFLRRHPRLEFFLNEPVR